LINSQTSRAEDAYTDGVRKVGNGDTKQARLAFLRAISLDPTHSMAWNELGYLRETKEKDIDGALSAYRCGRLIHFRPFHFILGRG
jgi:tetratricopeptide (TPR) repeat protein